MSAIPSVGHRITDPIQRRASELLILRHDIESFMERNRMAATRFGDAALGDRHLVRQLRNGRRLWPETEQKVRAFMETYREAAA